LRWLFGAVFVFSGFVKAIDPLGSSYKFHDYFMAMGIPAFNNLALILAILLSAVEMLIGLNMITGIRLKETSLAGLAFMLFMTPLTLWIALKNPVHDCGCFGDALIIGNTATFVKNLVLLAVIVTIFLLRRHHTTTLKPLQEWILTAFSFFCIMTLSHFNYHYLPMVDFRPYKPGSDLVQGMKIPKGAALDEYSTTLIYEKNGEKKEFTVENCPVNDKSWKFVEQKTVLVKKGYTPPVSNFSIQSPEQGEITDIVLQHKGYSFLLIMHDVNQAGKDHLRQINSLYQYAGLNHYPFYCLSGSTDEDNRALAQKAGFLFPMCFTDPVTLKTMIRSNPGLILLHDGTVINHWPDKALPHFAKPLGKQPKDEMPAVPSWVWVLAVAAAYTVAFAVVRLLLKKYIDREHLFSKSYHTN
jgi:uncharacterized membrane protein YphA (DoxX/SURF4 family)